MEGKPGSSRKVAIGAEEVKDREAALGGFLGAGTVKQIVPGLHQLRGA